MMLSHMIRFCFRLAAVHTGIISSTFKTGFWQDEKNLLCFLRQINSPLALASALALALALALVFSVTS